MSSARESMVASVIDHVRARYVVPERTEQAAHLLGQAYGEGHLGFDEADPGRFCDSVTAILQEATGDLHLRLIHHPAGAPNQEDAVDYASYWKRQAAETSGGVRSVTRTPENVAVLELGPFLGLPVYAGRWQAAALNLCHGAAAVVLDLRDCVGGTPESAALVCSYLLGPEPVHLSTVEDRSGRQQFWTLPMVPGEKLGADIPVAIAVSARTFSGGEEIAFNLQELKRASVVGEVTRGGAHPRVGVRLHPHIELALPVARPVSPRSGGNWEGKGVVPDILVPEHCAVQRAVQEVTPPATSQSSASVGTVRG